MKKNSATKFRLKIFMWYIITEPIRQIINIIKNIFLWFKHQNKTLIWAYVASALIGISFAFNSQYIAALTVVLILIIILLIEYNRGYFMHRWREKEKARVLRKAEKEGLIKKTN